MWRAGGGEGDAVTGARTRLELSKLPLRGEVRRRRPQFAETATALFAGKTKLGLPGTAGMDDLPIALRDGLGIKGGTHDDLPVDGQRRYADAIRFQIGSE